MALNIPNVNAPLAVVFVDPVSGAAVTPFTPGGSLLAYSAPTATVNNAAPAGFGPGVGRLDVALGAGAATAITGLIAGVDGQPLVIRNTDAANALTLTNQAAGSTAANRFAAAGDTVLAPGGAVTLIYYAGTVNRWVIT